MHAISCTIETMNIELKKERKKVKKKSQEKKSKKEVKKEKSKKKKVKVVRALHTTIKVLSYTILSIQNFTFTSLV